MYTICILLGTLVIGALYLITSSTTYEPPESDDDGGTGLYPMPPTFPAHPAHTAGARKPMTTEKRCCPRSRLRAQ